jgi:hypothetical protein
VNIREDRTDLLEPGTDHYNIEKKHKIHEEVIAKILETCPRRDVWVRTAPTTRAADGKLRTAAGTPATIPARNSTMTAGGKNGLTAGR